MSLLPFAGGPFHLDRLKTEFGQEITLVDDEGTEPETPYQILREFDLAGTHYAILRSPEIYDAHLFRVSYTDSGPRFDHIEDEREWDEAADAIDDLLEIEDQ